MSRLACLMAGALLAADMAAASDLPQLGDPHLAVVPRTAAETARIAKVLAPPADFSEPRPFEGMPGGAATSKERINRQAFSHPSANMALDRQADFSIGNGFFEKLWITAPASTLGSDGLGPLYNARSCQRCHLMDGRGHPPSGPEDDAVSMVLQISRPGGDPIADIPDYVASLPDPVYGHQLQDFGAPGQRAEFRLGVSYAKVPVALAGGEAVTLRRPAFAARDLGYGPLDPATMVSARVAPPMIGAGLLEAIPAERILTAADPDDADGDGISGRPNIVWSEEFGRTMLGRFGWKAGQPTVRAQAAAAFSNDMGISSPMRPAAWGDCSEAEPVCRAAPQGASPGETEIDAEAFDLVAFYSRNLAVPRRRDVDAPEVLRGKEMFYAAGCPACHTPAHVTHRLKDRPEARSTGGEWRTPPLWGLGLTETVSGQVALLHDGRARNVLEAVLWHGGEARAARDRVVALPPADRAALVAFLESL